MKLLLDENLSHRLVNRIADLFPESIHVSEAGPMQMPDSAIWQYARDHGFSVLSADSDFFERATALGAPPKVIWLKGCDYPTREAEGLIRSQAIRIVEFLEDPERAVLILPKQVPRGSA